MVSTPNSLPAVFGTDNLLCRRTICSTGPAVCNNGALETSTDILPYTVRRVGVPTVCPQNDLQILLNLIIVASCDCHTGVQCSRIYSINCGHTSRFIAPCMRC